MFQDQNVKYLHFDAKLPPSMVQTDQFSTVKKLSQKHLK